MNHKGTEEKEKEHRLLWRYSNGQECSIESRIDDGIDLTIFSEIVLTLLVL
jgi:hypothetical protein